MKLGNPIKVVDGVYQVRAIGVRVTVLVNGGKAVLVDSGLRGSMGLIAGGLRALDLSLEQVLLIVVTHYHPDHAGELKNLVEATSAKIAVHHLEAGIISGEESPPHPIRNGILAGLTRPLLTPLYGQPVKVDYKLEDGETLAIEEDVRVVHTPGHTAGSICLYLANKGLLIIGDALQHKRGSRLSPPATAVSQNTDQAIISLEKLLDLDFDTICFGHFPPLRQNAREALRRMLEDESR